jgi:hypothetical protein
MHALYGEIHCPNMTVSAHLGPRLASEEVGHNHKESLIRQPVCNLVHLLHEYMVQQAQALVGVGWVPYRACAYQQHWHI